MTPPRLVVLSDCERYPRCLEKMAEIARLAIPETVALVLRDREQSIRCRLRWGRRLREDSRRAGQSFWVSDRLDLALLVEADGVHLPSFGLSPPKVRPFFDWVSRAAHDVHELDDGELRALSAVFVSPAAAPRKGRPALGVTGVDRQLAQLRARAPGLLVYALGGITEHNAPSYTEAGAAGVAVIGAALDESRDARALLASLGILDEAKG